MVICWSGLNIELITVNVNRQISEFLNLWIACVRLVKFQPEMAALIQYKYEDVQIEVKFFKLPNT